MNIFTAPVAGQSLTDEPGNYPWERPPMYNDPEAALQMHLDNLTSEKAVDAVVDLLEAGVSVHALTKSLLTMGVAGGKHTVDTSLIIGPVVHEYVKMIATTSGVDFTEGFEDVNLSENDDALVASRVNKLRAKLPKGSEERKLAEQTAKVLAEGGDEIGIQPIKSEEVSMEEPATVEQPAATPSRGLMSRTM